MPYHVSLGGLVDSLKVLPCCKKRTAMLLGAIALPQAFVAMRKITLEPEGVLGIRSTRIDRLR